MSLSMSLNRTAIAPRLAASRPSQAARPAPRHVMLRASPASKSNIEEAIEDAQGTCADDAKAKECAAAWDTVEELSAHKSHQRDNAKADPKSTDPLEIFCDDNPDADECRVYED